MMNTEMTISTSVNALEFRTAETGLLATRSGILKAAYEQQLARAEWDRATGRYFQFSDDTAPSVHSSKP